MPHAVALTRRPRCAVIGTPASTDEALHHFRTAWLIAAAAVLASAAVSSFQRRPAPPPRPPWNWPSPRSCEHRDGIRVFAATRGFGAGTYPRETLGWSTAQD